MKEKKEVCYSVNNEEWISWRAGVMRGMEMKRNVDGGGWWCGGQRQ